MDTKGGACHLFTAECTCPAGTTHCGKKAEVAEVAEVAVEAPTSDCHWPKECKHDNDGSPKGKGHGSQQNRFRYLSYSRERAGTLTHLPTPPRADMVERSKDQDSVK